MHRTGEHTTYRATLAPRQSAALVFGTLALLLCVAGLLLSLSFQTDDMITWCRDFVVAQSARRGAAGVATVTTLALLLSVAIANVASFAVREVRSGMRLAAEVVRRGTAVPARVRAAAAEAGVRTPVAVLDDGAGRYALTVGLLRPRILLSASFVSALTLAELRAVLRHEEYHAMHRHPLRAVGWEVLRRLFFFLPSIGDVTNHFALRRELAADDHANRGGADVRPLASALLKAMAHASGMMRGGAIPVHVAPFGHLHDRIRALADRDEGAVVRFSMRRAAATLLVIAAVGVSRLGVSAGSAGAQSPPNGGSCAATAMSSQMSTVNFSPYLSIRVPATTVDEGPQMSTGGPASAVQETANPR